MGSVAQDDQSRRGRSPRSEWAANLQRPFHACIDQGYDFCESEYHREQLGQPNFAIILRTLDPIL